MAVTEAKLVEADGGLEPEGSGWFVLNAREARHAAGVAVETREPKEAYKDIRPDEPVGYRDGWL